MKSIWFDVRGLVFEGVKGLILDGVCVFFFNTFAYMFGVRRIGGVFRFVEVVYRGFTVEIEETEVFFTRLFTDRF